MRYRKSRVISLLSALVLLGSVLLSGAAFGEGAETAGPGPGLLSAAGAAAVPENQWQKTAAFPDWKGYTDDTLAMNSHGLPDQQDQFPGDGSGHQPEPF